MKRRARKHPAPTPPAFCTLSFAAQVLGLSHPGARFALAHADITPILVAQAASGRRVKLFGTRDVLGLARARTYKPPQRGGVRRLVAVS